MEFTRKVEVKSEESENRMPSIVEAGALAVATTIKPHSLTSNNEITSPNNESFHYKVADGLLVEPMPLSSGIPKRPSPGNTNIRDIWTKSLVLLVLIATSGFVMWNGKKWIFSYKKLEKEEEEKDEVSSTSSIEEEEEEKDEVSSTSSIEEEREEKVKVPIDEQFSELIIKGKLLSQHLHGKEQITEEFSSLLDTLTEELESYKDIYEDIERYNQFMFSLANIEVIWKQLDISSKYIKRAGVSTKSNVFKREVVDLTYTFIQEFIKRNPDFDYELCSRQFDHYETEMVFTCWKARACREEVSGEMEDIKKNFGKRIENGYSDGDVSYLLDQLSKLRSSISCYLRPFLFYDSLAYIQKVWNDLGISLDADKREHDAVYATSAYMTQFIVEMKEHSHSISLPDYEKIGDLYFDVFKYFTIMPDDCPKDVLTFWNALYEETSSVTYDVEIENILERCSSP